MQLIPEEGSHTLQQLMLNLNSINQSSQASWNREKYQLEDVRL